MSPKDLDLADDTGFLLAYASGVLARMTNARLATLGLRVRHYSVLSLVCDREGASQREIAEGLGLDPSPVGALVDALEDDGLVQRLPHPADRRTRLVTPTPEGRAVREQARADVAATREEFLTPLPHAERDQLLDILRRLVFTDPGESRPSDKEDLDA
jgi:DNA-binding MarR family transcriptional regulator